LASQLKKTFIIVMFSSVIILFSCPYLLADTAEDNKNPIDVTADAMSYDNASDTYHAQGSVVIIYSGGVLTADDVDFDKKNNIASAYGNAFLKMGEDTMAGDKIVFNIDNKTGVAYKGRAFYAKNHFYIRGDEIEKTGELTYKIKQPVATTCDGDQPDWEIAGSEMKVTIEGFGLMKNARLVTGNVPVFYSPLLPFPAKTKRQSGFLFPYLSYSKDKDGLDIEIPYFWAISPQMDATFYQRYIEKRGFKEGMELRYYAGTNSFGTLFGDYMEDTKQVTETIGSNSRDWQDMHKRWSYYLNHQTNFDSQSYIRTDLRRVSDNSYFRDFTAHNYYLDHYAQTEQDPFKKVPFYGDESLGSLESTVRLYKGWSNYNLTALMSSTDNFSLANNDSTLQRYPEITFTGIKQPFLKTPVFYEMLAVYDYFYRGEGQKGHSLDFTPTFSMPFNISRYAKLTPQISLRESFWNRDDNQVQDNNRQGSRTSYAASLSMSSQVSRIFDIKVQNLDKIKHEIKPELSYSYAPNIRQDNIPDYVPVVAESNAITWAVTNTFTAKLKESKAEPKESTAKLKDSKAEPKESTTELKDSTTEPKESTAKLKDSTTEPKESKAKLKDSVDAYSYLEFLRVKLFQTYDINEAKKGMEIIATERRPLSDIGLEVDLKPHRYFSFSARNQYNVYTGWTVTNYDLNIIDWRGDNLTVSYRYTLNSIEEIDVSAKVIITDKIDGTFISRQDKFNSRTVENTIGFVYHKQCWAVGLDYTQTESVGLNNTKTADSRIVLKFSLSGLMKFGTGF
jgi:LPS-assembly protein